jgi:hypothetical protein
LRVSISFFTLMLVSVIGISWFPFAKKDPSFALALKVVTIARKSIVYFIFVRYNAFVKRYSAQTILS